MKLISRAILAIALIAGLTPVMAQVPPPVPALPDTERRTTYSINASTCACTVNMALFGDSTDYQNWVEVWLNGQLTTYNDPAFGWTITSPTGPIATIARPITDGVLTFNQPQTGTIQIVGARRPRRVSQFSESAGVSARNLNQVITDIVAMLREVWDKINDVTGRVVRAPPGETLIMLPPAASRANMGVCFDTNGNLVPCVGSSAGSFSAGNGVTFTGTNPTTIATNLGQGFGVVLTGTNPITISTVVPGSAVIAAASTTFTSAQCGGLVSRSNSGAAMGDTLPGTSAGVLPVGCSLTISNTDTAGIESIKVATGATLKTATASTGYVYVCPGQSAIFFSDGSNYWQTNQPGRCRLQGSTTIFIATTGSASNDGLTSATPLPDTNTAYSFAQSVLDVNYKPLTFSVANGTYPAVFLNGPLLGASIGPIAGSNVTFLGNATTPGNVVISTSTASNAWLMANGANGQVNGFAFSNTTGHDFQVDLNTIALVENLSFLLTGGGENFMIAADGSIIFINGNLTAVAGAANPGCVWIAGAGGSIQTFNLSTTVTFTFTGAFNWNTAFACTQYYSTIIINTPITFTASSVTGHKYTAGNGSTINSAGGGANFFPGSLAGTSAAFGTYQ